MDEHLTSVLAFAPIIVFELDKQGTYTLSEGLALQALGRLPGETIGRSIFDVYHDEPRVSACARRALSGESFTALVRLTSNATAWDTRWRAKLDGAGGPAGVVGVAIEVTEQMRAQDALEHSERELRDAYEEVQRLNMLKDEFVATVSHEFRTPLSVIQNAAKILGLPQAGTLTDLQRRYVDMVSTYAARLTRLVDDVLDLQRLGLQSPKLDLLPGNVMALLIDAAEAVRPDFVAKGLRLVLAGSSEPMLARLNGDRLTQVLLNLLENGIKFTPAGGEVRLDCVRQAGRIIISITDTGIGIAAADRQRIFERFVQVDGDNTSQNEGCGLGLAIVKALVEDTLGGSLWLESELGRGSTFFVGLPAL